MLDGTTNTMLFRRIASLQKAMTTMIAATVQEMETKKQLSVPLSTQYKNQQFEDWKRGRHCVRQL